MIEWCKALCKESETVPEAAVIFECGSWSSPVHTRPFPLGLVSLAGCLPPPWQVSGWCLPQRFWNPTRPPLVNPPRESEPSRVRASWMFVNPGFAVSACFPRTRGSSLSHLATHGMRPVLELVLKPTGVDGFGWIVLAVRMCGSGVPLRRLYSFRTSTLLGHRLPPTTVGLRLANPPIGSGHRGKGFHCA